MNVPVFFDSWSLTSLTTAEIKHTIYMALIFMVPTLVLLRVGGDLMGPKGLSSDHSFKGSLLSTDSTTRNINFLE